METIALKRRNWRKLIGHLRGTQDKGYTGKLLRTLRAVAEKIEDELGDWHEEYEAAVERVEREQDAALELPEGPERTTRLQVVAALDRSVGRRLNRSEAGRGVVAVEFEDSEYEFIESRWPKEGYSDWSGGEDTIDFVEEVEDELARVKRARQELEDERREAERAEREAARQAKKDRRSGARDKIVAVR